MPTEFITPRDEQHWLELRRQDVTSTEASALFGMSPYCTQYELWLSKRSGDPLAFEDNERMEAGRFIEPAIAALVASRYGVVIEPFKEYGRDADCRMGSSFDARAIEWSHDEASDMALRDMIDQYGEGIIECKNVDGLIYKRKWMDDETPAHIEIQLQHQLELSGYEWGAVAALVGGNRLEMYIRKRDREVGAAIREAVREFWRSIDANEPPPIVYPDDADVVIAMHQFSDGTVLDLREDTDAGVILAAFDDVKKQLKDLEEREKVLKARILELAGDAGSIVWDGGKISLTQTKDTPPTVITPEMVGTTYGGRKGLRQVRSYPKAKEPQQ